MVLLDQEKAYDRISHRYLWKVMKFFNIPIQFINIVKTLYSGAKTTVMINGMLSSHFQITRGVCQGDPLSCLLFNMAIEPLAELICCSPKIDGFNIPGVDDPLKASLFADDTAAYLCKTDKIANY
jgi:hypothetical protein